MKDKKYDKKVAGKFIAIISSTKITSLEDNNISPLGTDVESEGIEAARPTEEAAGHGSDSDSEVTVKVRNTELEKEREHM